MHIERGYVSVVCDVYVVVVVRVCGTVSLSLPGVLIIASLLRTVVVVAYGEPMLPLCVILISYPLIYDMGLASMPNSCCRDVLTIIFLLSWLVDFLLIHVSCSCDEEISCFVEYAVVRGRCARGPRAQ
jgi:hypothetical protein